MPKFSVLIIEDEKNIQTFMGKVLKRHDYQVLYADTGKQGLEMIRSRCPDLILLDLGLPDMDGCSIIRDVRTWASTPIIVISARTAEREKVAALDLGADDYITKPFGMMELVSRVKAVLRRSSRNEKKDEIVVGQLKIYPNKHKVKSCGNEVTLTNKEFKLLCLLVESKGNVLNRDQLLTNIWGYDFDGETRTVDVHIRSLRQKLGECGKLIETVRGIGYRIGGNES